MIGAFQRPAFQFGAFQEASAVPSVQPHAGLLMHPGGPPPGAARFTAYKGPPQRRVTYAEIAAAQRKFDAQVDEEWLIMALVEAVS